MKEFKYTINGNTYNVSISKVEGNVANVAVNGEEYHVILEDKKASIPQFKTQISRPQGVHSSVSSQVQNANKPTSSSPNGLKSPLPGVILSINVKVGDEVKRGQTLMILEAMKMENEIKSGKDGKVASICINKGDSVLEGTELIVIE